MGAITNKNNQTEGFRIGSQSPIDDRLVMLDLVDLVDLGTGNYKPYKYYEGMRVWVLSEKKEYVWMESTSGALTTSFTYAAGTNVNGINYGGRSFNFVSTGVVASGTVLSFSKTEVFPDDTGVSVVVSSSVELVDISIYDETTLEDLSDSMYITISTDTVTILTNLTAAELTANPKNNIIIKILYVAP